MSILPNLSPWNGIQYNNSGGESGIHCKDPVKMKDYGAEYQVKVHIRMLYIPTCM